MTTVLRVIDIITKGNYVKYFITIIFAGIYIFSLTVKADVKGGDTCVVCEVMDPQQGSTAPSEKLNKSIGDIIQQMFDKEHHISNLKLVLKDAIEYEKELEVKCKEERNKSFLQKTVDTAADQYAKFEHTVDHRKQYKQKENICEKYYRMPLWIGSINREINNYNYAWIDAQLNKAANQQNTTAPSSDSYAKISELVTLLGRKRSDLIEEGKQYQSVPEITKTGAPGPNKNLIENFFRSLGLQEVQMHCKAKLDKSTADAIDCPYRAE